MSRLRYRFAPVLVWMLVPILHAQEKAPSPWLIDRSLTVSPRTAPVPALKYRLSPLKSDLKEGNAAPIYLRLVHEQNDASRKYWSETPRPWNLLPVDKIPLEEARKFLDARRYMLRQFEIGARRRTVDWNYTLDEGNIISILLPDAQVMRQYVPMLVLQIRVALAEGDFAKAAHHMETGFAFSQHVGDGPFLINSLVGIALAAQFTGTIADLIERSDAPNFYWAIATLPHPFIDMRRALDQEYRTFEGMYPELADVEREQSAEHWNATLRRIRMDLRGLATERDKLPDWYPKNCAPEDPAAKSPDFVEARKYVARTRKLSAEKVESMPAAQVLLLYIVGTFHEDRDAYFEASYLPYPQARTLFILAEKRLRDLPSSEGHVHARTLLPALSKVKSAQMRIERNLAALQLVKALRMYAAGHDGKLPGKLADVTEVPVPNDPGTGQPFEFKLEGDTATVISRIPDDPSTNGYRYRVTIRKK